MQTELTAFTHLNQLYKKLERKGLIHQNVAALNGAQMRISGQQVMAYTSAGFLGLQQHPKVIQFVCQALQKWSISLGFTRNLGTTPMTPQLEEALAALTGQPAAMIYPSTTHIAVDALPLLAGNNGIFLVDRRAYATSLVGVRQAQRFGTKTVRFQHNDLPALVNKIRIQRRFHPKIIVVDGVSAPAGDRVPLDQLIDIAKRYDALIYMDDSNGIGILGENPNRRMPFGYGGQGTAAYYGITPGRLLISVGSMSKAFGVPMAFIAGPQAFIRRLKLSSTTAAHCSPPSIANVAAALAAMRFHAKAGNHLRQMLYQRVMRFRHGLQRHNIRLFGSKEYPIQSLAFDDPQHATQFAYQLRQSGIWAVMQFYPADSPGQIVLRFLLTVEHSKYAIDRTVGTIAALLSARRQIFSGRQNFRNAGS